MPPQKVRFSFKRIISHRGTEVKSPSLFLCLLFLSAHTTFFGLLFALISSKKRAETQQLSIIIRKFANDSDSPLGLEGHFRWYRTFTNVIFYGRISQIPKYKKIRNRTSTLGVLYPVRSCSIRAVDMLYNMSRRGLSRVDYPCTRQCESPTVG